MKVDGRCHCGRITFEAEIDPARVGICHCTDCQMLTGSAYRVSVPAPREGYVLRGEVREYVKVADSGNRRAHAFCPDCGTPIYATAADGERVTYSLRVGTLRQRADLPPQRQIWCDSAVPWSADLRAITRANRQ